MILLSVFSKSLSSRAVVVFLNTTFKSKFDSDCVSGTLQRATSFTE